ncbi:response regulator [Methanobacterium sp.]|uniref:response regulator n=1 Tax=Methanobacterium sp. TaxID=2164 RepID=UPI003C73F5F9
MELIDLMEVLIVEDNPADARLIKEAFSGFAIKHSINIVNNGLEATNYLFKKGKYKDSKTPNLILLDLNLPLKDGRDVLKEIKKDDKLRLVPVIILTTSKNEDDICEAYKNYANAYLPKPTDFEEFERVVNIFEEFWFNMAILPKCGID